MLQNGMVMGASGKGLCGDKLRHEAGLDELGGSHQGVRRQRPCRHFREEESPGQAKRIAFNKSFGTTCGRNARLILRRWVPDSARQVSPPAHYPISALLKQGTITRKSNWFDIASNGGNQLAMKRYRTTRMHSEIDWVSDGIGVSWSPVTSN